MKIGPEMDEAAKRCGGVAASEISAPHEPWPGAGQYKLRYPLHSRFHAWSSPAMYNFARTDSNEPDSSASDDYSIFRGPQ
jgi:hypothetical protein